jgi:hypothetical protein
MNADLICIHPRKSAAKNTVDDLFLVPYHRGNTGKEVILKYMSSNHSEVAAA